MFRQSEKKNESKTEMGMHYSVLPTPIFGISGGKSTKRLSSYFFFVFFFSVVTHSNRMCVRVSVCVSASSFIRFFVSYNSHIYDRESEMRASKWFGFDFSFIPCFGYCLNKICRIRHWIHSTMVNVLSDKICILYTGSIVCMKNDFAKIYLSTN